MTLKMVKIMVSKHYKTKRHKREKFIKEHLHGDGEVIDSFIVDNGHCKGIERHEVTSNGLIIIYNNSSNLLVSKLIARPQQIRKLYKTKNKAPPKWLIKLALHHQKMNYNR